MKFPNIFKSLRKRSKNAIQRNYDAGSRNRLNDSWYPTIASAEVTNEGSRELILARARDMERNSDVTNSILSAFERNVIGKGYVLQVRIKNEDALSKQIEEEWHEWCKKENCDVAGTQSFISLMRMAIRRKKIDGGILFLKCFSGTGRFIFQIQAIEVDELSSMAYSPTVEGNTIVGGVEYTQERKIAGYWFEQYDIDGSRTLQPIFYPANRVIYYFTKKRPSQIREMSDMSSSLLRTRDLNEFLNSVQVAKRVEASFGLAIKRLIPQVSNGTGRIEQHIDNQTKTNYKNKKLSPGIILELNPGDDTAVIDPKGRGDDAAAFSKFLQRMIGSGQGLSYEAISRDMSESNYSSARQSLIEDDITFSAEVDLLKEVMSNIYETSLSTLVMQGIILIPNYYEQTHKYSKHEWIRKPKAWIDPQKEAASEQIALQSGLMTFKEVSAGHGRDWRDTIDDMTEVINYAKSKNLDLMAMISKSGGNKNNENITNNNTTK